MRFGLIRVGEFWWANGFELTLLLLGMTPYTPWERPRWGWVEKKYPPPLFRITFNAIDIRC